MRRFTGFISFGVQHHITRSRCLLISSSSYPFVYKARCPHMNVRACKSSPPPPRIGTAVYCEKQAPLLGPTHTNLQPNYNQLLILILQMGGGSQSQNIERTKNMRRRIVVIAAPRVNKYLLVAVGWCWAASTPMEK